MGFTKIINKFGNEFIVPDWKAEEMIHNKEIELKDCTPVEVEHALNTELPETQSEFEAKQKGKK